MKIYAFFLLVSFPAFGAECLNLSTVVAGLKEAEKSRAKPNRHEFVDVNIDSSPVDPETLRDKIAEWLKAENFLKGIQDAKVVQDECRTIRIDGFPLNFDVVDYSDSMLKLEYDNESIEQLSSVLAEELTVKILSGLEEQLKELKKSGSLLEEAVLKASMEQLKEPAQREQLLRDLETQLEEKLGSIEIVIKKISETRFETTHKSTDNAGVQVTQMVLTAADDEPITKSDRLQRFREIAKQLGVK